MRLLTYCSPTFGGFSVFEKTLAEKILKELKDELAGRVKWSKEELEYQTRRLSLVDEALKELKWLKSERHR